ncbi:MAG: methionyl-tRNA formyltransferase [Acidimicrobiia bacterium]|nr:MAG: methionyl-tRNA formyltransferase [Acidimicrobiia bacterium]
MGAVFLGTPAAAIPSLAALADVEDIDLVVTQPDRQASRGRVRTAPAVKIAAQHFGFPVAQPKTREDLDDVLKSGEFSLGVVVAYGQILTPDMLATAPYGFLNVHFSLLPRWRGPAPVERAIMSGDKRTGVTLMKIDEGIDTGAVLAEIATPIGPNETGGSLTARLSYLGASLVDGTIPEYLNGHRIPVPQIASGVSHAKRLSKAEARMTPGLGAEQAERSIRAFQPRPVAWVQTVDGRVRIHGASATEFESLPGLITLAGTRVIAGFDHGTLELRIVQPEGKQPLDATAWMHGRRGQTVRFE